MEFLNPLTLIKTLGLLGVFSFVFAESGLLIGALLPGDSLLFTAGIFAGRGFLSIWILLIGAIVAAIVGDSVGYMIGKKMGQTLFNREDSWLFKKSYVAKTQHFYAMYGVRMIIVARFIPIVRTFAPVLAGVGLMPYNTFLRYNIIGGIAWVSLFVGLGYFLGNTIGADMRTLTYVTGGIVIVSIVSAVLSYMKMRKN